jgi:hypothetical protein
MVALGSSFTLKLETKPGSTAYDWYQVGELPACLSASKPVYIPKTHEGPSIPGASSMKEITFTVTDECSSDLRYEYYRLWEGSTEKSPAVLVHVYTSDRESL